MCSFKVDLDARISAANINNARCSPDGNVPTKWCAQTGWTDGCNRNHVHSKNNNGKPEKAIAAAMERPHGKIRGVLHAELGSLLREETSLSAAEATSPGAGVSHQGPGRYH